MGKRFDLLTREGLERVCSEFEEMGRDMSPLAHMMTSAAAAQAEHEMETEIEKGKRPSAEIPFREFFALLMISALRKESADESK